MAICDYDRALNALWGEGPPELVREFREPWRDKFGRAPEIPYLTVQERFTAHAEARDYEIQRGLRANPVAFAQRLHAQQLLDRDLLPHQQQEVARLGPPLPGITPRIADGLDPIPFGWDDVERVRDAPSLENIRVVAEHRRAAFMPVEWLLAYLALAGVLLAVGSLF